MRNLSQTSKARLSPRQAQVAERLRLGRRAPDIARELGCAPSTVYAHVRAIGSKISAPSQRIHAVTCTLAKRAAAQKDAGTTP